MCDDILGQGLFSTSLFLGNETSNANIFIETNEQKDKHQTKKIKSEIQFILAKLKRAKEINLVLKTKCLTKYNQIEGKIKQVDSLLEKVKRISKSKPKKHIKYPSYIPLEHIYYYTTKKIHIYYHLLDGAINSVKKYQNDEIIPKRDTNRFHFTKEEDAILKNILFLSDEGSSYNWYSIAEEMNKLILTVDNNNNKEKRNVFTPLKCYVRYLETGSFYKYKKWTKDEDNVLRRAIIYYGPKNWQQISYCLNGRNNSQCFHRWMKGINPKIKRDKWTYIEDLTLGIALTKIYGYRKWSKIANHLPGRTDIQCRERWCNILDPSLEEVEWTQEEDIKLLNMNRKYGNKWSKIAKEYGNRTDNTCWRRWKFLTENIRKNMNGNNKGNYGNEDEQKDKKNKVIFKVLKNE